MHFQIACTFGNRWARRAVRIACSVLLMQLAVHSMAFALTSSPPSGTLISQSSMSGSYSESERVEVQGGQTWESQQRNATFTTSSSSHATVEHRAPDWGGLRRDTGILFGSQIVAAGILYAMPESTSGWSNEQKKNSFKRYSENVFDPVIDKDQFYINYVLHPYWGATYYIRARERGLDKGSSFIYSALISAMYEFGVECFFEKPSIQDLIVTPMAGSLLGAFIFEPLRESIKRKQELRWYDHVALVLTDPVGVLSSGFENMFGIKSTVMVEYSVPQLQMRSTGMAAASKSPRIGVVLQFPL